MPRSALTGTEKKEKKKEIKFKQAQREIFKKEQKRERHFNRETQRELRAIQKGEGLPSYKGKEKFEIAKYQPKASYEKQTLAGLQKDFARATKGAEKIFAPTREQAISDFQKYTQPSIASQFTGGGTATSSAAKQATASAAADLQRALAADFSHLQAGLATNLLGQREQSRQFGAQFGSQQEQFGAGHQAAQNQFGAQFRGQQEQFGSQSQLANLNARLQASGLLRGQPVQPQFTGLGSAPSYQQKQQQGGTSGMGGALIGGGLGALGSYAGTTEGAAALTALFSSSRDVKENIRSYNKGLEVVRELDVKQYDYIIPVQGTPTDRVGLIAEDVPSEIQSFIGDIKAIDVYGLVGLLVNAVKQLDEKVKVLEAR